MWTIARKEFGDRLRNRWIWTVSALLLMSALSIAFFGSAPVGVAGAQGGGAVLASLMNLSVYLVPLLALILGAGAIVDEKRRGTLDLVLTYPVSPSDYFIGTFLGYCCALWVSLLGSFLPVGVVLVTMAVVDPVEYLMLVGLVVVLGTIFLALSFLVSILSRDHGRGVASSILLWIVAVFVFDLTLVGLLVLFAERISRGLFGLLLLLNPTDIFRLLCFSWIGSAASPLGLATLLPPFSIAWLTVALVAWVIVPLVISHQLFHRRLGVDNLV